MERQEVIRLARECGMFPDDGYADVLERFAALVAAAEREACAKVCDEQASEPECPERAAYCAAAIRARGAA